MNKSPRILLMAGGTGGHIFPALAVAKSLSDKGWITHWLGSDNGMEVTLIPQYQIDLSLLNVRGIRGKGILTRLMSPLFILHAVWQAIKVIRRFKPDVVLGMGGFASGPGGMAAWLLRRPLCIHEQNAIPGVTNRILSKFARFSLQAFPGAFASADEVTGNPVRESIYALPEPTERFADRSGAIRLLVVGGSRGAAIFNELLPEAVDLMADSVEISVWHQTGKDNRESVMQRYKEHGQDIQAEDIRVEEFITDMDAAYQWADFILCRAGALTVSELAAAGLGAIFVPFPHAVDDHQTANAGYLVDAGAAEIIQQSELDANLLAERLVKMADRKHCLELACNAKKQARPDATKVVADFCIRAAEMNNRRKAA